MESPDPAGDLVQSLAPPTASMWLGPLSPYGVRVFVYEMIELDVTFSNVLWNSAEQCTPWLEGRCQRARSWNKMVP